jgi:predicted DNA-binding protein
MQILTTTVRINAEQKTQLDKVAKQKKTKFSLLLNEAIENYLQQQQQQLRLETLKLLQKKIVSLENWTAESEVRAIKKSRNSKKFNLE